MLYRVICLFPAPHLLNIYLKIKYLSSASLDRILAVPFLQLAQLQVNIVAWHYGQLLSCSLKIMPGSTFCEGGFLFLCRCCGILQQHTSYITVAVETGR
jgi:hypothetical protein